MRWQSWSIASVLKTEVLKGTVGSNPTLTAVTMVLMVSTTDCGSVGTDSSSVSHLNGRLGEWLKPAVC